jgi:excinuclease ABC subunit A
MAIATGTPEEVAAEPASHTGRFLAQVLAPATRRVDRAPAAEAGPGRRAKLAA